MMVSQSERCGVCGRGIARTGHAKAYVHEDQFHQRFSHQPVVYRAPARAVSWSPAREVIDLRDVRVTERVSA